MKPEAAPVALPVISKDWLLPEVTTWAETPAAEDWLLIWAAMVAKVSVAETVTLTAAGTVPPLTPTALVKEPSLFQVPIWIVNVPAVPMVPGTPEAVFGTAADASVWLVARLLTWTDREPASAPDDVDPVMAEGVLELSVNAFQVVWSCRALDAVSSADKSELICPKVEISV